MDRRNPLAQNVLAYYPFNEGQGIGAINAAGNAPATLVNGVSWVNTTHGRALSFVSGSSQYITCGNDPAFTPSGAFSVVVWINTDNPTNFFQQIVAKSAGNGSSETLELRFNSSSGKVQFVGVQGGSFNNIDGNTVLSANTWYQVAATYDLRNLNLYVNGIGDATPVAASGAPASNTESLAIGARRLSGGPQFPFSGFIEQVLILPFALSSAQLKNLDADRFQLLQSPQTWRYLQTTGTGGNIFRSKILNSSIIRAA